jgi:hypothetical protein
VEESELTAWVCAVVEDGEIRVMEQIADGMDTAAVHAAQARALRDLLSGSYAPGGVPRPVDLTEQWWQLRAVVNGAGDHAGLGGGPASKPPALLRSVQSLAAAALAHVTD